MDKRISKTVQFAGSTSSRVLCAVLIFLLLKRPKKGRPKKTGSKENNKDDSCIEIFIFEQKL